MNIADYPRIAVVGCPGAGKSTLARKLAGITGHPLIHLDYHYWQPGWVPMPKPEFIALQKEWVQGERWIIDGNYKGTLEIRYAAADLVICLDLPRLLCMWRAFRRRGKPRPDMHPGVNESRAPLKDHAQFYGFIWNFRRDTMPKILALHEKYPSVAFLHVRSDKQAKGIAKQAGTCYNSKAQ